MKVRPVLLIPILIALLLAGPALLPVQAATVSGGGLALDLDEDGTITAVRVDGRPLSLSSSPGGIALRDVTGANQGSDFLLAEGFEGLFDWLLHPENSEVNFTVTEDEAYEGSKSLLCQAGGVTTQRELAVRISDVIPVEPGTRYRLQCAYKCTRGYLAQNFEWQRKIYEPGFQYISGMGVFWTDEEGTIVTEDYQLLVPLAKQARTWKEVGGEFVVPAGRHYVRVALSVRLDPLFSLEGFWADAIELFESPAEIVRVEGTAAQSGSEIEFQGAQGPLEVTATWSGLPDSIEVSGTVSAREEGRRSFDLLVSVPVDAAGWTWPDSAAISRTIEQGNPIAYSYDVTADVQAYLPVSIYPYGGVFNGEAGLAAVVPLEPDTMNLIRYDAVRGAVDVVFHLAVAPDLEHPTADFSLRIYPFDPADGFRGIIQGYRSSYQDRTDWFESDFDASPYRYFDVNTFIGKSGAEQCAFEDASDVMSVQYTVADMTIKEICPGTIPPPTLEELFEIIEERKQSPDASESYYYTYVTEQIMDAPNGDPVLKHIDEKAWSGGHVEAVLKINPSPAGTEGEGMHKYTEDSILYPAFESTGNPLPAWGVEPSTLDAVQLDNFKAAASVDCTDKHIRSLADHSLTYSMADYSPGLSPVAGHYDYLGWMRTWLDEHINQPPYRGIQINWKGLGITNYALPRIDICAGEVGSAIIGGAYGKGFDRWANFDPEVQAYKRALAYHKIRGMAFEGEGITEQDVIETQETCLLFGMAAGFKIDAGFVEPFDWEASIPLSMEHNARVSELYRAGWEPLTHATVDQGLALERYGDPEDGIFFLVVHNYGDEAVSATITLSPELELFLPPRVVERISGEVIEVGGAWPERTIPVSDLGARRSRMYEITLWWNNCAVTGQVAPDGLVPLSLIVVILGMVVGILIHRVREVYRRMYFRPDKNAKRIL